MCRIGRFAKIEKNYVSSYSRTFESKIRLYVIRRPPSIIARRTHPRTISRTLDPMPYPTSYRTHGESASEIVENDIWAGVSTARRRVD